MKKYITLIMSILRGHSDIVPILLDHGANIEHVRNDGFAALAIASQEGKVDIVSMLIGKGANIEKSNN